MKMKKYISILLCLMLCFAVASGCANNTPAPADPQPAPAQTEEPEPAPQPPVPTDPIPDTIPGTITMADGGVMKFELYPHIAPQAVYNFIYLARQGFYDGLTFHRIISGFMAQGGCPDGTGSGGPGYSISGEFADNGFENNLLHTRGIMSMARRGDDYNSAGSQFFLMHAPSPFLDGSYAGFGQVTEGLDVLEQIMRTQNDGPNGSVARADRPAIESITIDSDVIVPWPDFIGR